MYQKTYSLLRSKTFWLLVIAAFIPVANAIVPTLPLGIQDGASAVLSLLAIYTHNLTAQNSGATN